MTPGPPLAQGVRTAWTDLPGDVRRGVERVLGGRVVGTLSQPSGFSPGSADRVWTDTGRRAFVKTAGVERHPIAVELHRREARIVAVLPPSSTAPALLGGYDAAGWVAVVFEDLGGRTPHTPWTTSDLAVVLAALRGVADVDVSDLRELPDASAEYVHDFAGWARVAADPPTGLDPWAAAGVDELAGLSARAAAAIAGDRLVHGDLRADNLLVTAAGVRLVDWPAATRGAAWFDTLSVLVNVELYGGHDVDALARAHISAPAADVDAVLAAMAGYFVDAARRPPPPGLPTVRAFQAAQASTTLAWLRRRIE